MLSVYAGRFPCQMQGAIPFRMVQWESTQTVVKSRNAPFMVDLETNKMTFTDKETDTVVTLPIESNVDAESIRLDCPLMLDFWMELKRV